MDIAQIITILFLAYLQIISEGGVLWQRPVDS